MTSTRKLNGSALLRAGGALVAGVTVGALTALFLEKACRLKSKISRPLGVLSGLSTGGATFIALSLLGRAGSTNQDVRAPLPSSQRAKPTKRDPEPAARIERLAERVNKAAVVTKDTSLGMEIRGLEKDEKLLLLEAVSNKEKRREILWTLFDRWEDASEYSKKKKALPLLEHLQGCTGDRELLLKRPGDAALATSDAQGLATLFKESIEQTKALSQELSSTGQKAFIEEAVWLGSFTLKEIDDEEERKRLLWVVLDRRPQDPLIDKERFPALVHLAKNESDLKLCLTRPGGQPLTPSDAKGLAELFSTQEKALRFFLKNLEPEANRHAFADKLIKKGPLLDELVPFAARGGLGSVVWHRLSHLEHSSSIDQAEALEFARKVFGAICEPSVLKDIHEAAWSGQIKSLAWKRLIACTIETGFTIKKLSDKELSAIADKQVSALASRIPLADAVRQLLNDRSGATWKSAVVRFHLTQNPQLKAAFSDVLEKGFKRRLRNISTLLSLLGGEDDFRRPVAWPRSGVPNSLSAGDVSAVPPYLEATAKEQPDYTPLGAAYKRIQERKAHDVVCALTASSVHAHGKSTLAKSFLEGKVCIPRRELQKAKYYGNFIKTTFPHWQDGWGSDQNKCEQAELASALTIALHTQRSGSVVEKLVGNKKLPQGALIRIFKSWLAQFKPVEFQVACDEEMRSLGALQKRLSRTEYVGLIRWALESDIPVRLLLSGVFNEEASENNRWKTLLQHANFSQLLTIWGLIGDRVEIDPEARQLFQELKRRTQAISPQEIKKALNAAGGYQEEAIALCLTSSQLTGCAERTDWLPAWVGKLAQALEQTASAEALRAHGKGSSTAGLQALGMRSSAAALETLGKASYEPLLRLIIDRPMTTDACIRRLIDVCKGSKGKRAFCVLGVLTHGTSAATAIQRSIESVVREESKKDLEWSDAQRMRHCLYGWTAGLNSCDEKDKKPSAIKSRTEWQTSLTKLLREAQEAKAPA